MVKLPTYNLSGNVQMRTISTKATASGAVALVAFVSVAMSSPSQAMVAGRWGPPNSAGPVTGASGGKGPLAVCRAQFDHGQQPGKVWQGQCHFEWGKNDVVAPGNNPPVPQY